MNFERNAIERDLIRFQVLADRLEARRPDDSVFADEAGATLINHFVTDASIHVAAVSEFIPPMAVAGVFAIGIDAARGTPGPIWPNRIVKMAKIGKQFMVDAHSADVLGLARIATPPVSHTPGALVVCIP